MRNIIVIVLLGIICSAYAQSSDQEKIIRELEQKEVIAVLEKDTATLMQIWSDDFTVNNPLNKISKPGVTTLDRPVINRFNYSTFNRTIENVMIMNETAITMGSEIVIEKGPDGNPGRTVNRRYTNIWMKEGGDWKLTARHANIICE